MNSIEKGGKNTGEKLSALAAISTHDRKAKRNLGIHLRKLGGRKATLERNRLKKEKKRD